MGLKTLLSRTYDSLESRVDSLRHPLLIILIIGLAVRILLLPLTNVDSWGWYRAGEQIISGDGFYARSGYVYGPLFGYLVSLTLIPGTLLFGTGIFSTQSDAMIALQPYFKFDPAMQTIGFLVMFKMMMVLGDAIGALLVRWMVIHYTNDEKKGNAGFALLFLSPIVFVESSIHGMFDIYVGVLALLSIYFVVNERYAIAGVSWAAATLMKIFPAYLFPVFIAIILKRNGPDIAKNVKDIGIAAIGASATLIVLYLPQILDGTFWDTWGSISSRLGGAGNTMGTLAHYLWILIPIFIVLVIMAVVLKKKVHFKPRHEFKPLTAKKSISIMLGIILLVFAGLIVLNGGVTEMFQNLFHSSYIVGIGVQGIAFIFAIIFSVKLYYSKMEDQSKLVLMVGTIAIASCFLWVPMPEYLIIILPMVCVYALVYDRRYITPFLFISIGATVFIIMVEGPAALFVSVAQYTSIIDIDTVIGLVKAYVGGPGVGDYSIYQLVFCAIGAGLQLAGTVMLFVYRFKPYRLEEEMI